MNYAAAAHRRTELGISASIAVHPGSLGPLIPQSTLHQLPTHRDLLLQALLHLPRMADQDGTVPIEAARSEIERLRRRRAAELASLRALSEPPAKLPRLDDLVVRMVPSEQAAPVLQHFHYLRTPRRDAVNVAAIHAGRIAAVCCFSPLDLPAIGQVLPLQDAAEVAVISRVFAFDWAPRNVISYMLARAEQSPRIRGQVRALLTYVNPNMGFSGASFRAANWLPFGSETGTRYAYLDGSYITDREVRRLALLDRARVEYSRMPLRPLTLLCRLVDRRLHRAHPGGFDFVFHRP